MLLRRLVAAVACQLFVVARQKVPVGVAPNWLRKLRVDINVRPEQGSKAAVYPVGTQPKPIEDRSALQQQQGESASIDYGLSFSRFSQPSQIPFRYPRPACHAVRALV